MKTIQAYGIAFELREEQYHRCYHLLTRINFKFHDFKGLLGDLQRFVQSLSKYLPSEQWLFSFCEKHKIVLKNQESLVAIRRSCGKKSIIHSFYSKNSEIFKRDPRLL